ncbi:MAG: AI-2E family transporter [Ruminococcus sp.]|nr:AI-2E family transporter [Ruminococcus sp.]
MERKDIKRYLIIAAIAAGTLLLVQNFSLAIKLVGLVIAALNPLIIGTVIAYIFNIIMGSLEKRYFPKHKDDFIGRTRRPMCLVLSFLIALAAIALILKIIIPQMVEAVKIVGMSIPEVFEDARSFVLKKLDEYPKIQDEIEKFDISSIDFSKITTYVTSGALGVFNSAVAIIGTVTSTLTNTVIGIIFAIYLLARKDKLRQDMSRFQKVYFSEKTNRRMNHILDTAHNCFRQFFIGQFIEAILLGTLTFIGSSILQLPYSAMTGVIVGVSALIPIVGALVGTAISALVIVTVNPMQAVIFVIFIVILQQIDNNIFYPKIVGSSVGLPGIWVLAAVTVGGSLCGVIGMLIGVPLWATVYKLYYEELEKKEKKMGIYIPETDEKPVKVKKNTDKKTVKTKK